MQGREGHDEAAQQEAPEGETTGAFFASAGFVAGELLISATTLGLTNVFGALCHGGE